MLIAFYIALAVIGYAFIGGTIGAASWWSHKKIHAKGYTKIVRFLCFPTLKNEEFASNIPPYLIYGETEKIYLYLIGFSWPIKVILNLIFYIYLLAVNTPWFLFRLPYYTFQGLKKINNALNHLATKKEYNTIKQIQLKKEKNPKNKIQAIREKVRIAEDRLLTEKAELEAEEAKYASEHPNVYREPQP